MEIAVQSEKEKPKQSFTDVEASLRKFKVSTGSRLIG
jgi:hypothetical protein